MFNRHCARCALRKISSTLVLQGVKLEELASRLCGRFPDHMKYLLLNEIRKYQPMGLKSMTITNISVDKQLNLIVDFDLIVDPEYNGLIRKALSRAIVTLNVSQNVH